jgi:L-rhamnose mutarotase
VDTDRPTRRRYCFLLRVRPELLPEYRERHAHVWPEMQDAPDEGPR